MGILASNNLKAGGGNGGGEDRGRPLVGVVQGFEGDGADMRVKIRITMPGSKMDGKTALVGYDQTDDTTKDRAPMASRVVDPSLDPADRKNESKIKLFWHEGKTVVQFDRAKFSGEGKGGKDDPYQMSARWGSTFAPAEDRLLFSEAGRIVQRTSREGEITGFTLVDHKISQSFAAAPDEAKKHLQAYVDTFQGEGKGNPGATVLALDADGTPTGVARIGSFYRPNGDEGYELKAAGELLAEVTANNDSQAAFAGAAKLLVIPHETHNYSQMKYLKDEVAGLSRQAEQGFDKDGDPAVSAMAIAMNPDGKYVSQARRLSGLRDPIVQAMQQVGLMEKPAASQNTGAAVQPDPNTLPEEPLRPSADGPSPFDDDIPF